jgi:lipopolysaccharide transport system permease protein
MSPNWLGLAWTLVRTDFKTRFHGTLSGFVWALLKPVALFVVLMSVFSFLFQDPAYKLRLVVGLFLWDFFAEGTKTGLASLHAKSFLFRKLRVPLWIIVVTGVANPFITLFILGVVVVAFLAAVGQAPSLAAIGLFALYGAALTLIVVGFSLATSVLFLRFRDLNQVWDVVTQAGFFLAPIVYPLGIVPERYHLYFYAWPPTPIIEFSRLVLVDGRAPSLLAHVYLLSEVVVVLVLGALILRRMGPRAAEFV